MFGKRDSDIDPFGAGANPDSVEWDAIRQARKAHHVMGVKILMLLVVFMSVLSMGVAWKSSRMASDTLNAVSQRMSQSQSDSPGRETALDAVYSWLSGSGSPAPDGYANLQWAGVRNVGAGKDGGVEYVHDFTFTGLSDGRTRRCSQLVSVADGVADAVGSPSLFAMPVGSSGASGSGAPDGYRSVGGGSNIEDAVDAWAKAWIGGDSKALTVLVGDPDSSHAFMPAGFGVFESASVDWSVWCDSQGNVSDADSGWSAVGVTVRFTPNRVRQSDASGVVGESSTSVTVLVRDPSSGSARVVDWGALGVVKGLREFGEALDAGVVSDAGSPSASVSVSDSNVE
ncbi:hypothetical protein [Pseudoscardovia suis]|uniref:Aromatic ring-opening dioxygenase LigA n=1 Tax=Pseudoscardovia suis TaxID=987063 RepID=A0A261EPP4_9BIFI|nr:hypothetical protein [Pseudoscardovia suis]OZG48821.1 aromatic ring-opening dioxygenase LigA [Pseudoscardovia suis]PJJ63965.1 hypothetical protein CLV65_1589 [Pseudoscardovia suis]